MRTHPKRTLALAAILTLSAFSTSLLFAQESAAEIKLPLPNWKPAVRGALPDGPKFNPTRPKPAPGEDVLNIESLLTPPDDRFTISRRNNFNKKPEHRDPNGDAGGLYRFAASGHFTNYSEIGNEQWRATVPDPLKMLNGQMVTDAETWRKVRRPELVRIMEFYMFGKVPDTVPQVEWTAGEPTQGMSNGIATITRTATGRFVNKDGTPWVNPNPAGGGRGGGRGGAPGGPAAPGGAPAVPGGPGAFMDFDPLWFTGFGGGGGARGGPGGAGGGGGGLTVTYTIPANATGRVPVVRGGNLAQLLPAGLGVVSFGGSAPNVRSNPPADDDWGNIRKTAWVVSKGLDYLETDAYADAQTAVTGHSIIGKQALMAAVFDERVTVCFASCSGLGGAQMARHDWGETIDDVAQLSPDNYCNNLQYWVSRYNDMPFDAHFLLALVAPRTLLVTGGSTDQWSDPVGVFWSAHYAAPVYKLLGEKAFDDANPPTQNTFIGDKLVFYHHIGGHMPTADENAKYIEMQKQYMKPSPKGSEKKVSPR